MARSSNGSSTSADRIRELMAADTEKLDQYGDPMRGESESDKNAKRILAILDELGGQTVGDDSLVFTGSRFVLPASMEGDVDGAVRYLKDWDRQQNTEFSFSRT